MVRHVFPMKIDMVESFPSAREEMEIQLGIYNWPRFTYHLRATLPSIKTAFRQSIFKVFFSESKICILYHNIGKLQFYVWSHFKPRVIYSLSSYQVNDVKLALYAAPMLCTFT